MLRTIKLIHRSSPATDGAPSRNKFERLNIAFVRNSGPRPGKLNPLRTEEMPRGMQARGKMDLSVFGNFTAKTDWGEQERTPDNGIHDGGNDWYCVENPIGTPRNPKPRNMKPNAQKTSTIQKQQEITDTEQEGNKMWRHGKNLVRVPQEVDSLL